MTGFFEGGERELMKHEAGGWVSPVLSAFLDTDTSWFPLVGLVLAPSPLFPSVRQQRRWLSLLPLTAWKLFCASNSVWARELFWGEISVYLGIPWRHLLWRPFLANKLQWSLTIVPCKLGLIPSYVLIEFLGSGRQGLYPVSSADVYPFIWLYWPAGNLSLILRK